MSSYPVSLDCLLCEKLMKAPRTLPCHHSFCATCLLAHRTGDNLLFCPVCAKRITLSDDVVRALPCLRFLSNMATQVCNKASLDINNLRCQFCGEAEADSQCRECSLFACATCKKTHLRPMITSNHRFLGLEEALKGGLDAASPRLSLCPAHQLQELDTLCKTCHKIICPKCATIDHSGHHFSSLAEMNRGNRNRLAKAILKAEALVPRLDESLASFTALLTQLLDSKKSAGDEIERIRQELLAMVESRIGKLLKVLDEAYAAKQRHLLLERDEVAARIKGIDNLTQLGADLAKFGTDIEVACDTPRIAAELESLGALSPPLPGATPEFGVSDIHLAETRVMLSKVGGLCEGPKQGQAPSTHAASLDRGSPSPSEAASAPESQEQPKAIARLPKASFAHLNHTSLPSLIVSSRGEGMSPLSSPWGVAINHARNFLVVTEGSKPHLGPQFPNVRVSIFKPDGSFIKEFGKSGTGSGEFSRPWGVATDPATQNIYVADFDGKRIQIFSERGYYISSFPTAGHPCYLAFDRVGRIYVTLASHRVQVFESGGAAQLCIWGRRGNQEGELDTPQGIAVSRKGEVVVCEYRNKRLSVFTKQGKFLTTIGLGQVERPYAVCLDEGGNLLVTDDSSNSIHIFGPDGTRIREFGNAAKMRNPYGVTVDNTGRILVADCGNNRVLYF